MTVSDELEQLRAILIDRIAKLERQNAQLRAALEWFSVDDELPDRNDYYIICWKFEDTIETGEAWWDNRGWTFPNYVDEDSPTVLYWMKMPEPPDKALASGGMEDKE